MDTRKEICDKWLEGIKALSEKDMPLQPVDTNDVPELGLPKLIECPLMYMEFKFDNV